MPELSGAVLSSAHAFHQRLLNEVGPVWKAILSHRFLASVADGSISERAFKTWIAQDYLFVREEIPFLGILLAKAPPDLRPALADAVQALNHELELFRQQAEAHGVALDGVEMSPTCHAYVQFLMATAYGRSFEEGFAVLYGVEKAYLDSWAWVKGHQSSPSPWQAFIDNWTSHAFQDFVDWLAGTLDRLVVGASEADLARMEDLFLLTARYEYLFWEMAAAEQGWPI
jgi:thiaminase/transcriptional activator TenA